MPAPPLPADCPPGLEYLGLVDTLVVKQVCGRFGCVGLAEYRFESLGCLGLSIG